MQVDEFGRGIQGISARSSIHHAHHSPAPSSPSPPRYSEKKRHSSPSPLRAEYGIDRYVVEPMLCEYLYNEQQQQQAKHDEGNADEESQKKSQQTYDEYRTAYVLNYLRSFFKRHKNDSWFRNRYSPLLKRRLLEEEYERAGAEAAAMMEQGQQLQQQSPDGFMSQARLGHGVKIGTNTVPTMHTFASLPRIFRILNVPCHVSDYAISAALHALGGTVHVTSDNVVSTNTLCRNVICMAASVEQKKLLFHNMSSKPVEDCIVPRKDETQGRSNLTLTVDCSSTIDDVMIRKEHLQVSTEPISTQVAVISAALSSKERFSKDKEAAIMIGRALDVKRQIPRHVRMEDLMEQLAPTNDEDALDIAIAYLRRVHLFSFYNACTLVGDSFVQVLNGNTAAGVVHLRLQRADELLLTNQHDTTDDDKADMLVTRLDDAIQKAMEATSDWVNSEYMMSEEEDAQARELEALEQQTQQQWIKDHIILEDGQDGRARCAFERCRKLFKDGSFLRKHLLKKHSEYLREDVAKCHERCLLQAWENEEGVRPVPEVMVRCGVNLGLQAAPVVGLMVVDPEPELWRKEEERRKRLEEHEEMARNRRRPYSHGGEEYAPRRNVNAFVDVDDMKEEKVELKFDDVEIPVEPPQKKKRKKLL